MDTRSESTNYSKITPITGKTIASKLRRLKIQEGILVQDLQKTSQKILQENPNTSEINIILNSSDVLSNVKESYSYVKNLFDDINTLTHSRELLADVDISEMREKVLEFETKLKSLKTMINTEMKSLRTSEQELFKQLNEEPKEIVKNIKERKTSSAKFCDIVPSPVRVLMTSPLKSVEVQQFQDFMKNSGNRYGGWNEYNHNIFVKYWQKRFGSDYDSQIITNDDFLITDEHELFILEVLPKLQGVTGIDIKSHIMWYNHYLFLKGKQQKAIEKWKWNRKSIRHINNETAVLESKKTNGIDSSQGINTYRAKSRTEGANAVKSIKRLKSRSFSLDRQVDPQRDNTRKRHSTYMQPTTKWLSRAYDDNVVHNFMKNYSVENIEKLCTPHWRQNLLM